MQCRAHAWQPRSGLDAIETLAHLLAGLEERHMLFVYRDMRAGTWVASGSSRPLLHRKRAEAAQFHAVATRQRGNDFAQYGVDDVLDVALIKMRVLCSDTLNEF